MRNNMVEVDGIGFFVPPRTKTQIDAALISAAPDMYEALAAFVADCSNDECEFCIAARAALRKARGET